MSQPGQDPTLHWIQEATATLVSSADPEAIPGTTSTFRAGGATALTTCIPQGEVVGLDDEPGQLYGARHEELQELRRTGICRGFVAMDGIHQGDEVVLELATNPIERDNATCIIRCVVEGTVDNPDESKGTPGIVLTVKEDEVRTNPDIFINGPINTGSRVVLYGTALPSNGHMRPDDRGKIVRNQTPVICMNGEHMPQTTTSTRRPDGRQLELRELTINEVSMFNDEER